MRHQSTRLVVIAAVLGFTLAAGPILSEPAAARDRVVIVRAGQTLSEIAMTEGVSVDRLVELNHLADPNRILAGQRLLVPGRGADSPPQPSRQRDRSVTHRVAGGETLSGIALRHGTSVAAIARVNGIGNPSFIRAGQRLRIPVGPVERGSRTRARPEARGASHRVGHGETLWGIALRYGTSVAAIVRANGIANPSFIRAGQLLTVAGARAAARQRARGGERRPGRPNALMPSEMAALVAARQGVARIIVREARRQRVPAAFALAVAWQESGWQPNVVSSAGAIGVMQLLPSTAEWVSAVMLGGEPIHLRDARSNVRAGVRLLRHYLDRYDGSLELALAAYYQGQAAADRYGVYPLSRPYVASIRLLERIFAR